MVRAVFILSGLTSADDASNAANISVRTKRSLDNPPFRALRPSDQMGEVNLHWGLSSFGGTTGVFLPTESSSAAFRCCMGLGRQNQGADTITT